MKRAIIFTSAAVVALVVLALWALPSPRSSPAEQCADSPAPAACRALAREASPAAAAARDLGSAGPADLVTSPLVAGRTALDSRWYATAYRLCGEAGAQEGVDRVPALVCQGRAALGLGWPQRAAWLAARALDLEDTAPAHVLAGDAMRGLRDCRSARIEFLRALDLETRNEAAIKGLEACGATPPAAPDLTDRSNGVSQEGDGDAIT